MKSLGWFVTGIVGGLALGHVLLRNPTGKAVLDEVDARAREFAAGVREGFDARTTESSPKSAA